ncbi:hypothetical protein ACFS4T_26940 [Pseudomonas lini]
MPPMPKVRWKSFTGGRLVVKKSGRRCAQGPSRKKDGFTWKDGAVAGGGGSTAMTVLKKPRSGR